MQRSTNRGTDPDGTQEPSIPSGQAGNETEPLVRASPSSNRPILRRLNGRAQACDPCRSRKVACDNTQPVCRRCLKRDQASQCVYTISDQTSVPSPTPSRRSTRTGSSSTPRRNVRLPRPHKSPSNPSDSSQTIRAARNSPATVPAGETPPRSEGYLGYTSYSNVFDEARNTLSFLNNGNPGGASPIGNGNSNAGSGNPSPRPADASRRSQPPTARPSEPLPARIRNVSLEVLRSLPDPSYDKLQRPQAWSPTQYWGRYASDRILATLKRRYGSMLGSDRDDVQLELMARDFCANSRKPFDNDVEDPEAFLEQFAGEDLRWESIGLLFCFREYAPDVNGSGAAPPPRSRVWDKKISLELWSEPARRCLHLCLDLAKNFTEGNSILMFLYIRHMVIDSLVYGDASFELWLSHAAAVAMVTFLGLHAIPDTPDYKPCFASELKRRVFSNIFVLDKVGSSFHGRPPLLSYRWTTTPPPLDIPDPALLAGGDELAAAIASLDANGWTRHGQMESVTLARGRWSIAVIKEELMDIAFGKSKNVPIEVIKEIKQREIRIFEAFPEWCKYRDEHIDDMDISTEVLFCRLLLKLEHLQAWLLADRLIARHGGPDDGSLLYVSFELVRHVLVLWQHADRFQDGSKNTRVDFLWMVMSYGAPGGGVLCMELLFPTLPNRPIPYESPSTPRVTRSAIIQNLSLLIGFLTWVGPEAPNSAMTTNCKRLIQGVLDYTLNQVPPVAGAQPASSNGGPEGSSGAFGFLEGLETGQLDFGFDFLGTFDWFRSDEPMPDFGFRP